jgi:hypothetical protein
MPLSNRQEFREKQHLLNQRAASVQQGVRHNAGEVKLTTSTFWTKKIAAKNMIHSLQQLETSPPLRQSFAPK